MPREAPDTQGRMKVRLKEAPKPRVWRNAKRIEEIKREKKNLHDWSKERESQNNRGVTSHHMQSKAVTSQEKGEISSNPGWKLLDFAELKRSSISFFEIEKHETAISRWSRARTRAAKVGKGLSENSRAQKLALQHWLEAIDPRHRYGHNLHFYYVKWLQSQSKEPFFYWLDIGEGKEADLAEKCPRSKLHQQCIKYLGPMERKAYEVIVEDGKLLYKQSGLLVDTNGEPNGAKWIFVLSTSMNLYVGQKKKGSFQHSSFLAGGATSAAGRIVVENGNLKAVWPHSGHYQPTPENFQDFIAFLKGNNVDLTNVKMESVDKEEEEYSSTQSSVMLRSISSEQVGWTRQIQRQTRWMDRTNYLFKLQCHALEKVNLSPGIAGYFRSNSTRESIPNSFIGEIHIRKTSYSGELPLIRYLTPQSSPVREEASTTRAAAKQQQAPLQVSVSL